MKIGFEEKGIINIDNEEMKWIYHTDYFSRDKPKEIKEFNNCHLEFNGKPNSLTSTGYYSHFFSYLELEGFENIESYVEDLVNSKIKGKKKGKMPVSAKKVKSQEEKLDEETKKRLDEEISKISVASKELELLYYIPKLYIEMVADKQTKGLLLYGESSLGKSYWVKKVLKEKGIKDFVFVSGHITPMKFYEKLYQAKDSLVVFDDVDILSNTIILNMIKACLNENSSNVVEYHTSKNMDIPSSFIFNGNVIMLLNDIPKNSEHLKAVRSRVLEYELKFNREQILKIIFEIAHKHNIKGTELKDRLEIANWIKDNTSKAVKNLNIRLYLQAVNFFKFKNSNWKELTLNQIVSDDFAEMILQGISDDEWLTQTGKSIRTKQRLKKKLKD